MEDLLPDTLMFDILSRLPIKTLYSCQCVCKRLRDLVSDPYFVHLHHSRSPSFVMIDLSCRAIDWFEIANEVDGSLILNQIKSFSPKFSFLLPTSHADSVNGFIFMHNLYGAYIVNHVYQHCMKLPKSPPNLGPLGYGFGVSSVGEYKVIRICGRRLKSPNLETVYVVESEVYTLGTDEWRSLGPAASYHVSLREPLQPGVFLNSHVYWLCDGEIYDFDLTAETFKLFPSPPVDDQGSNQMLGVLKGSLSQFSWFSSGFTLWVMKESWCKEIAIQENMNPFLRSQEWKPLRLIDGLKGACVVIICMKVTQKLVAYCLNTNRILHLNLSGEFMTVIPYRPTFLNLQMFRSDRVHPLLRPSPIV